MPEPKLVTIASFSFLPEAELARSRLEAEEIFAHIRNEHVVAQNWLYRNFSGGLDLQVSSEDEARAREILGLPEPAEELEAETTGFGPRAEPTCPRCGSAEVREVNVGKRWTFLAWLIVQFPLLKFRPAFACGACGLQWREAK